MPPAVVALFFAAGAATWIYTKLNRSSGGNTQSSLIVSGILGVFAFVAMLIILKVVDGILSK